MRDRLGPDPAPTAHDRLPPIPPLEARVEGLERQVDTLRQEVWALKARLRRAGAELIGGDP